MLSTNPETVEAANPAAPPQPNFRGRWMVRIALLILHIVVVFGAASLTPAGYDFELGKYTGGVVIFGSILLWWLLFATKTRRGIVLFCSLVLGQAGFVALVGLHLRAEDRVEQSILEELAMKRREWASQSNLFRMDALFEMTSGKRKLTIMQLQELKIRARDGKANVDIVESDEIRFSAEAERRLASVSARAAQNFQLGVESTKQRYGYEQKMGLAKDYFTKCEQLAGLLIDRQGQYSQTPEGLRFKKAEDVQWFNDQIKAISVLQKQIAPLEHQLPPD